MERHYFLLIQKTSLEQEIVVKWPLVLLNLHVNKIHLHHLKKSLAFLKEITPMMLLNDGLILKKMVKLKEQD